MPPIEELYYIASMAAPRVRNSSLFTFSPSGIMSGNPSNTLENIFRDNTSLLEFNKTIRPVFEYFETRHQLPVIMVNRKGEYVVN